MIYFIHQSERTNEETHGAVVGNHSSSGLVALAGLAHMDAGRKGASRPCAWAEGWPPLALSEGGRREPLGETWLQKRKSHSPEEGHACSLVHVPRPVSKRQSEYLCANLLSGLPWRLSWSRICLQCRGPEFHPWVGKIPWRRERLPTPGFWPGRCHRLYSPRVAKSWTRLTFTSPDYVNLIPISG